MHSSNIEVSERDDNNLLSISDKKSDLNLSLCEYSSGFSDDKNYQIDIRKLQERIQNFNTYQNKKNCDLSIREEKLKKIEEKLLKMGNSTFEKTYLSDPKNLNLNSEYVLVHKKYMLEKIYWKNLSSLILMIIFKYLHLFL